MTEKERVGVSLPQERVEHLDAIADTLGVTRSEVVDAMLRVYIRTYPPNAVRKQTTTEAVADELDIQLYR